MPRPCGYAPEGGHGQRKGGIGGAGVVVVAARSNVVGAG